MLKPCLRAIIAFLIAGFTATIAMSQPSGASERVTVQNGPVCAVFPRNLVTIREEGFIGRPEAAYGNGGNWENVLGWLDDYVRKYRGPMPASPV